MRWRPEGYFDRFVYPITGIEVLRVLICAPGVVYLGERECVYNIPLHFRSAPGENNFDYFKHVMFLLKKYRLSRAL